MSVVELSLRADELRQLRADNHALKAALLDKQHANDALRLENAELRAKLCKVELAVETTVREYLK